MGKRYRVHHVIGNYGGDIYQVVDTVTGTVIVSTAYEDHADACANNLNKE